MNHKHITFDDARRFARLAMGIVPDDDPEWIAQYVASVRSCGPCGEAALRANRLLLPDEYEDRIDPNDWREDCLGIDDMVDLVDDSPEAQHLKHCAACQLRYQEALALSELGRLQGTAGFAAARTSDQSPTVMRRHEAIGEPILRLGIRVSRYAAGLVGALILEPDLISGLLGPGENKPVAEGIVRKGHPLQNVRVEVDEEDRLLTVSELPPDIPAEQLRLRCGTEILVPSSRQESEVRFDIGKLWQVGDHAFDLVLAGPSE
jgi:hypothetical protein